MVVVEVEEVRVRSMHGPGRRQGCVAESYELNEKLEGQNTGVRRASSDTPERYPTHRYRGRMYLTCGDAMTR